MSPVTLHTENGKHIVSAGLHPRLGLKVETHNSFYGSCFNRPSIHSETTMAALS